VLNQPDKLQMTLKKYNKGIQNQITDKRTLTSSNKPTSL
jgi:hypothetical protein